MPGMAKKVKMITPRQYAQLHSVAYTTVMNWLKQGLISGALKRETPTGHYWEIPAAAAAPELQPGRPANKTSKKGGKK
jgi:hypothetical protein